MRMNQTVVPLAIHQQVFFLIRSDEHDICGCCGGDLEIQGKNGRNYRCPNCRGGGKENFRPGKWKVYGPLPVRSIEVTATETLIGFKERESLTPLNSVFDSVFGAEEEAQKRNSSLGMY